MQPLPFLAAPEPRTRVVEATIAGQPCRIEFPIHGAILSGEEIHIAPHRYRNAFYVEASRLADALLDDGAEPDQAEATAARILSSRMQIPVALEPDERRAMIRHASIVADAESALTEEWARETVRKVTAAIRFRVPGFEQWTDADTEARIPAPMQAAIAAFIDEEREAGQPQRTPEEVVDSLISSLGKLAPAAMEAGGVEPSGTALTGEPSTGGAGSSGPTPTSSAASGSRTSPSRTSSRRSRKATGGT